MKDEERNTETEGNEAEQPKGAAKCDGGAEDNTTQGTTSEAPQPGDGPAGGECEGE